MHSQVSLQKKGEGESDHHKRRPRETETEAEWNWIQPQPRNMESIRSWKRQGQDSPQSLHRGCSSADTLISDFQPPEVWDKQLLLS